MQDPIPIPDAIMSNNGDIRADDTIMWERSILPGKDSNKHICVLCDVSVYHHWGCVHECMSCGTLVHEHCRSRFNQHKCPNCKYTNDEVGPVLFVPSFWVSFVHPNSSFYGIRWIDKTQPHGLPSPTSWHSSQCSGSDFLDSSSASESSESESSDNVDNPDSSDEESLWADSDDDPAED